MLDFIAWLFWYGIAPLLILASPALILIALRVL